MKIRHEEGIFLGFVFFGILCTLNEPNIGSYSLNFSLSQDQKFYKMKIIHNMIWKNTILGCVIFYILCLMISKFYNLCLNFLLFSHFKNLWKWYFRKQRSGSVNFAFCYLGLKVLGFDCFLFLGSRFSMV